MTVFTNKSIQRMALVLITLCACEGAPDPVAPPPGQPLAEIVDGAHNGGISRFFFLPPLVAVPTTTGTPDLTLNPVVTVCEWNGSACVATVAQFSAPVSGDHYHANWQTDLCTWGPCTLEEFKLYRLSVSVGAFRLGFIDLRVFSGQGRAKNVETNEYIAIQEGRTLPVAFRIETGIVASLAISPNPAVVARGSTLQLTATALDLHGSPVSSVVAAWSSGAPGVATVNSSGLLSGLAGGCGTISVTAAGLSATAPVRVTPLDPDLVYIDREPLSGFPYFGSYRLFAGRVDGCSAPTKLTDEIPLDNDQFTPSISPDGRFVAYIQGASDENSLRVARMDGSGEVVINTPGLRPYSPSWSPDGMRIAFGGWTTSGPFSGEVYMVNADGSGLHAITGPVTAGVHVTNVRWSPTTESIAFVRLPGSGTQLQVISSSGGVPSVLVTGGLTGAQNFAWAPDGSRIAYRRGDHAIALVNPDGTNNTVLSANPGYSRHSLEWSPDGQRIAIGSGSCPAAGIEVIQISSSTVTTAACATANPYYIEWSSASIAWSRDGSEVLYGRWRALIGGTAMFNVEAAKFDGSATRVVTTGRVPVVAR